VSVCTFALAASDEITLKVTHGEGSMFDEADPFENTDLMNLLERYAESGAVDREAWHGRVPEVEGLSARELSRLHGELIAQGWVEQNTGVTPACYRVTLQGLRAYRKAIETAASS
jgi:hypothetical protein